MSHPTREDWMSFIYDEADAAQKQNLTAHLNTCADCVRKVDAWRGTMSALDADKFEGRAKLAVRTTPWIRWAAAAAILLTGGILIGQTVASNRLRQEFAADSAQTRAAINQLAQAVSENRLQDQQAILATLRELETRRAGEMKVLREDLETVAANTQAQLGRLVSFTGQ